jgi:hypothetical protein
MLGSFELEWIAVDPKTIWITSRAAAEELVSVQFYPIDAAVLAEYASPESLVASLRGAFPSAQFEYDAPSKHLIALAPEAAHRELFRRLNEASADSDGQRLSQSAVQAP